MSEMPNAGIHYGAAEHGIELSDSALGQVRGGVLREISRGRFGSIEEFSSK